MKDASKEVARKYKCHSLSGDIIHHSFSLHESMVEMKVSILRWHLPDGTIDGSIDGSSINLRNNVKMVSIIVQTQNLFQYHSPDGTWDGESEGTSDGTMDGLSDGVKEGTWDGPSEGIDEGESDGETDGTIDGASEGLLVGWIYKKGIQIRWYM